MQQQQQQQTTIYVSLHVKTLIARKMQKKIRISKKHGTSYETVDGVWSKHRLYFFFHQREPDLNFGACKHTFAA